MASAIDLLVEGRGAELLGHIPHPEDERDYPLGAVLANPNATPFDLALAAVERSWTTNKSVKRYLRLATPVLNTGLTPPPAPPAPPTPDPNGAVEWLNPEEALDQGDTPHCVGDGGAQWGNTMPINDRFKQPDADGIYYKCKEEDGEPRAENGSTVHTLAKILQEMGRLKTYAWAFTIDEVIAWVLAHGPVIMGTIWTDGMFSPDPKTGIIVPTGSIAGGHCYVCVGYNPVTKLLKYLNSWSSLWGQLGYFYMHQDDAASILTSDAEAMAATELPLAA